MIVEGGGGGIEVDFVGVDEGGAGGDTDAY
jgi:hypothetical protein